jgi:hypothetical protein
VATANPPWAEGEVLVARVAAEVASRSAEHRLRATGPMPRRPRRGQDEVVRAAVKEVAAFTVEAVEAVEAVAPLRGRGRPRAWGTPVSIPSR